MTSKYYECARLRKNRWHFTRLLASSKRRCAACCLAGPEPPRPCCTTHPCSSRQCFFNPFVSRVIYLQFSNRHCQPSSNNGNSFTGSVTNGGTSNPLGYIMTPCHASTSSMMAFAIFRGRPCCLLVKCPATSDGYTAHRHFLQTTTCHSGKCSKNSSARSIVVGTLLWIFPCLIRATFVFIITLNNVAVSWFCSPERGLAASNPCRSWLPMASIIFSFHRMYLYAYCLCRVETNINDFLFRRGYMTVLLLLEFGNIF